eukprot:GSChrysophyteH2.ASY1.ANO1.871.1 assembled CDS
MSSKEVDDSPRPGTGTGTGTGTSTGAADDTAAASPVEFEFLWEMYRSPKRYRTPIFKDCVLNHIQGNSVLVTKKGLYFSVRDYCIREGLNQFDLIPRTYFLPTSKSSSEGGKNDDTQEFVTYNESSMEQMMKDDEGLLWICKPASLTNRGYGIKLLRGTKPDNTALTKVAGQRARQEGWIVQEYIERPLLVAGRKFDIRVFRKAVKAEDKQLQAYFYNEPYVRTSWKPYTLDDITDRECHLTNDAIQKKAEGYGQFEDGNKLTLHGWQDTITRDYANAPPNVVHGSIWPKIKELTALSINAGLAKLEKTSVNKSFELLGYDYMVTEDFQPLLIEVNSNPSLELSCPLLSRLILELVNAVFKTSVDKLCPPPPDGQRTKACESACIGIKAETNKFEKLNLRR